MHAGDDSYDGVPYADLAFAEVDWTEAIDHIRHRGQRQDQPAEFDLEPEWATEALADPHRLVGSAGSRSGLTITVLGWSPSAPARETDRRGRLVKVIVAPKDHPPTRRTVVGRHSHGRQRRRPPPLPGETMTSIRDTLAAEAAEAETRHDEAPGRMHRTHSTAGTTSQVYTLRMPTERLNELREVAEQSGEQPSTLMRRWVLERLDAESAHQPELADVQRALTDALHTLDHITGRRSA